MRKILAATALLTTAIATPAFAQDVQPDEFSGPYFGVAAGATLADDSGETILFDRDLNGSFGDTVTTGAGANAFAPGFCGGSVTGPSRPINGCESEEMGIEFSARAGYDIQMDTLVFGVVAEVGVSDYSSSVTAFSSTPASYTFIRDVDFLADLRARVGFTAGQKTLVYATAGGSFAKMDNNFFTTNTANGVDRTGLDEEAIGFVAGFGVEHKIRRNVSLGIEYLYRQFEDESSVRLVNSGTTPATNPFLLGNASGTDFIRSDDKFEMHALRAVVNFRF